VLSTRVIRGRASIGGCTAGGKLGAQDEGDEGETGDGKGMLRWWKTMEAACAMGKRLRSALWDAQGGIDCGAIMAAFAQSACDAEGNEKEPQLRGTLAVCASY
jgi:hypothetical protein